MDSENDDNVGGEEKNTMNEEESNLKRKDDARNLSDGELKMEEDNVPQQPEKTQQPLKKAANLTRGIVYLSSIPTAMDPQQIRRRLGTFGPLGRVFLQEDRHEGKKRAKRLYYVEGWVEFRSKRHAKRAAGLLNCSQVGGKKRHPWYADNWNIKYLPRFKWHHLVDRLAYERAVEEQKMRIEIGTARKEAHHFRDLADKADADRRYQAKGKELNRKEWKFYQKQTEEEIKVVIEGKKTEDGGGKKKKNRKSDGSGTGVVTAPSIKASKREVADEKKMKKRKLIQSIFQGGDDE